MPQRDLLREPVVITGVGLVTALGMDRETSWQALRQGRNGVRVVRGLVGDEHVLALFGFL